MSAQSANDFEKNNSQIIEAATYVQNAFQMKFDVGIVLGSGLSSFHKVLSDKKELSYSQIPNMPHTSVFGHEGKLFSGKLHGVNVLCFSGRFHSYEGIPWTNVCFQVLLMSALGIKLYIVTNAAGGLLDGMKPGNYLAIVDHLRFSARADPNFYFLPIQNNENISKQADFWSQDLAQLSLTVAKRLNLNLFSGMYSWTTGPCYETPAEVLFLKALGSGVVGMSTVPEVLMARQVGIRTLGFSMATNLGAGLQSNKLSHEEVSENALKGMDEFVKLISEVLKEFHGKKDEHELFLTPSLLKFKTDVTPIDKMVYVDPMRRANVLQTVQTIMDNWELASDEICTAALFVRNACSEQYSFSAHYNRPVFLRDHFPVNTAAGFATTLYFGHSGYENVIIVDMQNDGFSIEEASFMAVVFQELGVRRVLMQVDNPISVNKHLDDSVIHLVTDVYNHSALVRPLAYLYHMIPSPLRSSFTFQFNANHECTFMSLTGPSDPSAGELQMAKQFGADYCGTFSLMPYYAFRYCGIGVNLVITHNKQGFKSLPEEYLQRWLTQSAAYHLFKHGPICEQDPNADLIKRKMVQYDDAEQAAQFIKSKWSHLEPVVQHTVSTAIMDMDLKLPFDQYATIVASIRLGDIPNWNAYYNGRRAIVEPELQLLHLLHVKSTGEHCYAVGALGYPEEPNYVTESSLIVRVFQHLSVKKLLLASSMMTAYYKKENQALRTPLFANGSLVLIDDHVGLTGDNPMIGHNEPRWGPRFYDMSDVYSRKWNSFLEEQAKEHHPKLVPKRVNCLFHGNSNFQEYSKLERTTIAQLANTQVLATHGCREIIVARHHEQEKAALEIVLMGLIVGDGFFTDAAIEKLYGASKRALVNLLTLATKQE